MNTLLASVSPKKAETVFDDDQLKIYKKFVAANDYKSFVLKRRNSNFITSALKEARPMLEINPRDLDANEFLLNTPNFTIDLTSGDEIEHEADNYITKQLFMLYHQQIDKKPSFKYPFLPWQSRRIQKKDATKKRVLNLT